MRRAEGCPQSSKRAARLFLVVDLDALFLAQLLDLDVHCGDDLRLWIVLAIDDDAVLKLLGAVDLQFAVAREAIVPAAVPDGHEVGVFLESVGELGAGQLLNVEVALGVPISAQLDLSLRRAGAKQSHCTKR